MGNYIRIESLKYIDAVIYFPINKVLGPLLILIVGILLFADALSLQQFIGIFFSLSVPILLLSAVEHHRQRHLKKGLIFLVISTILSSASLPLDKAGLLLVPDVLFMVCIAQLAGTIGSASILLHQRGVREMVSHIEKRDLVLGLFAGILGFISTYTLFKALLTGYISLVYVIQAHYILIPIILSVWWYKEHMDIRKAVAIVVSSMALLLLYK